MLLDHCTFFATGMLFFFFQNYAVLFFLILNPSNFKSIYRWLCFSFSKIKFKNLRIHSVRAYSSMIDVLYQSRHSQRHNTSIARNIPSTWSNFDTSCIVSCPAIGSRYSIAVSKFVHVCNERTCTVQILQHSTRYYDLLMSTIFIRS